MEARTPLCFDEYGAKQLIAVPRRYLRIRLYMVSPSIVSAEMRPKANANKGRFWA